jgi:hypothetical protein
MPTSVSLHEIDISKTEVVKLDNGWVIRLYDDKDNNNNVCLFVDRAQDIYDFSKKMIALTVLELSASVKQDKVNV